MKIRKFAVLAFFAAALFGASEIQAQTIGFKLGANFSNINIDVEGEEFEPDGITTFMGGGFVRFNMGPIAIQPELLYVTRGFEESETIEGMEISAKTKFNYIEVPVLAVMPLSLGSGISPYLYAGPSFAFEVSCKFEFEFAGESESGDCDEEEDSERKKLDLGLALGGGLEFPMGPGAILVEGRYTLGLTNLSKEEGVDAKSRSVYLLAGYSIPIGRR